MDQIIDFINNNRSWIVYIPTIIFVIVLVLWFIRGLMKGFRKSFVQLILMVVSLALAAIVFVVLTNNRGSVVYNVLGNQIDSMLGVSMPDDFNHIFGGNMTSENVTLLDSLTTYLFKLVVEHVNGIENVPIEAFDTVRVMAEMVFRLGMFLVAYVSYFVFKFILWIIYLIFFKEKKYKKKKLSHNQKYHKHRLLGGVVGLVRGFLIGSVSVSVLGILIFLITAGRPRQESSFKDTYISGIYDIDGLIREFGDTGILKIFNNITIDDRPFYLFFANAVLQGKSEETGEVYYTLDEFTSFSGLAQDLLDVFNTYGGDTITKDYLNGSKDVLDLIDDLFNSEAKAEYDGKEQTFKEAMVSVVDKYEGSVMLTNLLKSFVATVVSNAEPLARAYGLPVEYANLLTTAFDSTADPEYYISPYDLINGSDVKELIKGILNSASELLAAYKYTGDTSVPANTRSLGLLNHVLGALDPLYHSIGKSLSIYTDNPEDTIVNGEKVVSHKQTKVNKVIDRLVGASIDLVADKTGNDLSNPYEDKDINWLDNFDTLFNTTSDLLTLTTMLETEVENNDGNYVKGVNVIFADGYEEKEEFDTAYDKLSNNIASFDVATTLLDSDLMYTLVYDKMLNSVVSSVNGTETSTLSMPRDITWEDSVDTDGNERQGEFKTLFNTVRVLVRNGILDSQENGISVSNLNNLNDMLSVFLEDDIEDLGNESVIEYTLNSKVIYYTMSLILSNVNTKDIRVLVPEQDFETHENGTRLIQKKQIVALVNSASTLVSTLISKDITSLDEITSGSNLDTLIDVLSEDEVKEAMSGSDILVSTASSLITTNLTSGDTAEYLVIPSYLQYTYDESHNQEAMSRWIDTTDSEGNEVEGEFSKLLNVLSLKDEKTGDKILDIDKLTNNDNSYYVSLLNISECNFNKLVASDIVHYSFTKILTSIPGQDTFKIIIPYASYDKENYKDDNVIGTTELYNTLHAASFIVKVNEETGDLDYDLNNTIDHESDILDSKIIQASLINTIYNISDAVDEDSLISLPTIYKNLNYNENDKDYIFNASDWNSILWVKNCEVHHILKAVDALELDLDTLVDGDIDVDALEKKIFILNDTVCDDENSNTVIGVIEQSRVIALTMTNAVLNNNELMGVLEVPEGKATETKEGDTYIKDFEWSSLVDALETGLGLSADSEGTLADQLGDVTKLINSVLGAKTDYPNCCEDYVKSKNALLKSYIIEATIKKNIINSLSTEEEGAQNTVVIPCDTKWELERNCDDSVADNASSELTVLLDTFKILGLGEVSGDAEGSSDGNNYAKFIEDNLTADAILILGDECDNELKHKQALQASMLQSHVLYATLANTLYDIDVLEKPQQLQKLTNDDRLECSLWYKNKELEGLFNVSKYLGLSSSDNTISFSIDKAITSLSTVNNDNAETTNTLDTQSTPMEEIAKSSLAYLTISKNILDVVANNSNLNLLMSAGDVLSNISEGNCVKYENCTVISTTELQNFINDLNLLGITQISEGNGSITVPTDAILSHDNLFSSNVFRMTISNRIITSTVSSLNSTTNNLNDNDSNNYFDYITSCESELTLMTAYKPRSSEEEVATLSEEVTSEDNYVVFTREEIVSFIKAINTFASTNQNGTSTLDEGDTTTGSTDFTFTITSLDQLKSIDASILDSTLAYSVISANLMKLSNINISETTCTCDTGDNCNCNVTNGICVTTGTVYKVTEHSFEKSDNQQYVCKGYLKNIMKQNTGDDTSSTGE